MQKKKFPKFHVVATKLNFLQYTYRFRINHKTFYSQTFPGRIYRFHKARYLTSGERSLPLAKGQLHDDVMKWKHFPRYWPFVWGIHRSPVNSPHKGQWRGALMFSLICVGINGWVNNRKAGDLRRYRAHYDVIVMYAENVSFWWRHHAQCTFLHVWIWNFIYWAATIQEVTWSS